MNEEVTLYDRSEFLSRLELDDGILENWISSGLIKPAGKFDDGSPFFDRRNEEEGVKIKALTELGFDLAAVKNIKNKVGLPSEAERERRVPGKLITIGELSERCGIGVRTLKHWEEKELITPDARSKGGFRLYSDSAEEFCRRIRELQLFGYTLEELKRLHLLLLPEGRLKEALSTHDAGEKDREIDGFLALQEALNVRMEELKHALKRWDAISRKQVKAASQIRPKSKRKKGKGPGSVKPADKKQ